MHGRKKIKKIYSKNQRERVNGSSLMQNDEEQDYEIERLSNNLQRDSDYQKQQRNFNSKQQAKKNKSVEMNSISRKEDNLRTDFIAQNNSQTLLQRKDQEQKQQIKSPCISKQQILQNLMQRLDPPKYTQEGPHSLTFKIENSNQQINSTPNIYDLAKYSFQMELIQRQKNYQTKNQKQKDEAANSKKSLEEQHGNPRHLGTLKSKQEKINIYKQKILKNSQKSIKKSEQGEQNTNPNTQYTMHKQTFNKQNESRQIFPTLNSAQIRHHPIVSATSNISCLASGLPQNDDKLAQKTLKDKINEVNQPIYQNNVQQHLYSNTEVPNIYLHLQRDQAFRDLLSILLSNNKITTHQKVDIQSVQNENKIKLLQNIGILPKILPQKIHENKERLFNLKQITSLSVLQFQKNLDQIKRIYCQLPSNYYFSMIGSLKIKDLKVFHSYFVSLTKILQLIKTQIAYIVSRKQKTTLKNKQIGEIGMKKLINLKRTYLFQGQVKNRLFQSTKILEILTNQTKIIEPVTQAYLSKKQSIFCNPDMGLIFLGQYVREKYRQLQVKFREIVNISLNKQEKLSAVHSDILQQQIHLMYMTACDLTNLQKKMKKLKSIISAKQEEKLDSIFQKKINRQMKQEWRDLNLFFELGQILEDKLKRGRQWRV